MTQISAACLGPIARGVSFVVLQSMTTEVFLLGRRQCSIRNPYSVRGYGNVAHRTPQGRQDDRLSKDGSARGKPLDGHGKCIFQSAFVILKDL